MATTAAVLGVGLPATASADPPPGRAYEIVSPPEKPSGASALSSRGLAMPARSADVGERVVYGLGAPVGESVSGVPNTLIFGERTATGWRARTAVRSTDGGNTPLELSVHEPRATWMSADGRELIFGLGRPLGSSVTSVIGGMYRAEDADAAPVWLSAPTDGSGPVPGDDRGTLSVGGTGAAQTVAFNSKAPLTAESVPNLQSVYVSRGGQLQVVSRMPDESVATVLSSIANSTTSNPARARRNDVAGNGRFVLFRIGGGVTKAPLYVRDLDEGETRQLAGGTGQPELAYDLAGAAGGVTGAAVMTGLVYGAQGSASDGVTRAYFYGVTGSASAMYEANLEAGTVTERPAIAGAPIGMSADGTRMLLLTPPVGGAHQLRYWDASSPDSNVLVGTLTGASINWGVNVQEPSADGRTWFFTAGGSLDPERPNATPEPLQLYRWTVGADAPTCLTCEPVDGVQRNRGARVALQDATQSETLLDPYTAESAGEEVGIFAQRGHGVSQDGRWLLFDSPDRLVEEDVNEVRDVYLWDRDGGPDGRLHLVTSGHGDRPSWALDLSPDGTNAFFATREGLVPRDTDGAYDVYTARIGKGFPRSPESCVAEACRPPLIPPPPPAAVGSGPVLSTSVGKRQGPRPATRKLRVRSVRTSRSRLTVRVDTPKPGRIRISGSRVRNASRTAKRATTYTVRVRLSARTRRSVARGKTVKVRLRVAFTPKGSKKATVVRSSVSVRKGR